MTNNKPIKAQWNSNKRKMVARVISVALASAGAGVLGTATYLSRDVTAGVMTFFCVVSGLTNIFELIKMADHMPPNRPDAESSSVETPSVQPQ